MPNKFSDALEEKISTVVCEIFENLTFDEVVFKERLRQVPEIASIILGKISLIEPNFGELLIILPKNYAEKLTINILGLFDQVVTNELISDSMGELLNTLAGRIMKNLTPSEQKFLIGLPQITTEFVSLPAENFILVFSSPDGDFYISVPQKIWTENI